MECFPLDFSAWDLQLRKLAAVDRRRCFGVSSCPICVSTSREDAPEGYTLSIHHHAASPREASVPQDRCHALSGYVLSGPEQASCLDVAISGAGGQLDESIACAKIAQD